MASKLVKRTKITTTTEIDITKPILLHINDVGNGSVVDVGILAQDFDTVPNYPQRDDERPLGEYAARQVYGEKGTPQRDFMSRSFFECVPHYVDMLTRGVHSCWKGASTMKKIEDDIGSFLVQQMKSTIASFGGKPNSFSWSQYKLIHGMNSDVLRATDTMYNSIKSESYRATKTSVTKNGTYLRFQQSYLRNIRRMKDVHKWVFKISN